MTLEKIQNLLKRLKASDGWPKGVKLIVLHFFSMF